LLLLPGTGTDELKSQLSSFKYENCKDFKEAMRILKEQTKTGDIILISPATAHFQSNYIDNTGKSLRKLIIENFNHT